MSMSHHVAGNFRMIARTCACLLALWFTLCASASAAPPAVPSFAHETSDLPPDPAVVWGKLENGARYAIMHNAKPLGRASLQLMVRTGSLQETDEQRGLAHFVEHLAFNGSTHFPPGTLIQYFQRWGMNFGGDTNAYTIFDATVYQLQLPDVKRQSLQDALTVFADFAGGLLLTPQSIEKERGIILSELRDRDTHDSRRSNAEGEFIAPNARFTSRLPIGLAQIIKTAQRPQFVDYYNTWYRPENLVLVAVGDFDTRQFETDIRNTLGSLKPRGAARPQPDPGRVAPPESPQASVYSEPDAAQVRISLTTLLDYRALHDTRQERFADFKRQIVLGMLNQRLQRVARLSGTPFTAAQASYGDTLDFMRAARIEILCQDKSNWQACMNAVQQELGRALSQGFQPEELREISAAVRNQQQQLEISADGRDSREIVEQLLESIKKPEVFTTLALNRAMVDESFANLTLAECASTLRGMFGQNVAPYIFVAGDVTVTPDQVVAAYAKSGGAVSALAEQSVAEFAYATVRAPGKVISRRVDRGLGATFVEFANGVRMNLKATKFIPGRIDVAVRVGDGLLDEPQDKPGLAMLGDAFIAGGLGKHSVEELDSLLAGRNVGSTFSIGADSMMLSGQTTPHDLLLQLQLLQAYITDPGYRPKALEDFRIHIGPVYAELAHDLNGPARNQISRLMAAGDRRFGIPQQSEVLARNFDELRAWLAPQLAGGYLEMTLVGDLDVETTLARVAETFGALPDRTANKPAYASQRQVSYPAAPIHQTFTVESDLPRGIVNVIWPATGEDDIHSARKIDILAAVLRDRLRERIRESMGQAYSPHVDTHFSNTYPGYGLITASVSVAPNTAPGVLGAIRAIAADLATSGVTQDEFERAIKPVLNHLKSDEQSNEFWLATLSGAQEMPRQIDRARSRLADYRHMTASDISDTARRYLNPAKASEFVVLPESPAAARNNGG